MSKRKQLSVESAVAVTSRVVSKSIEAPLDRVKLLWQCQNEIIKSGRLSEPYRGLTECLMRTYRTEGFLSLWRGNLIGCLAVVPSYALNFALKDQVQKLIGHSKQDTYALKIAKNIGSGGLAGGLTLVVLYSMDYCRIRLANDVKMSSQGGSGRQFNGIIDVYRKTIQSDGIVGLYRGFLTSCGGLMVYRGLYFGLYDTLRPALGGTANFFLTFCLGYCVSLTAGFLSYPLDTIRCRMLMRSCETVKYKGAWDCARQIVKKEGFRVLWRGFLITIVKALAGAALLVGYDYNKAKYSSK